MPERKTVGQLMEEMRLKAGAQKLNQFKELVKHAVVDRNKRKELER